MQYKFFEVSRGHIRPNSISYVKHWVREGNKVKKVSPGHIRPNLFIHYILFIINLYVILIFIFEIVYILDSYKITIHKNYLREHNNYIYILHKIYTSFYILFFLFF